jgi:hypothetical protein
MSTEEPDRQRSRPILESRDQAKVVALDIENDAAGLENAHLRTRGLDVLRVVTATICDAALRLLGRSLYLSNWIRRAATGGDGNVPLPVIAAIDANRLLNA